MIERYKWQPAIWLNSDPRSAPYFSIVASWGAVATIEKYGADRRSEFNQIETIGGK